MELQELLGYFDVDELDAGLVDMVKNELLIADEIYESLPQTKLVLNRLDKSIHDNILRSEPKPVLVKWSSVFHYWSAAALFLILSCGIYFYTYHSSSRSERENSNYKNDVPAGSSKAYLTLANGKRIELNGALKGEIARESNVSISKTQNGHLRYEISDAASKGGRPTYNTISTPKGGKYEIMLSDGTLVYLNSGSSIRFPSSFVGVSERRVEFQGEGYFEVSHREKQPFYVQSGQQLLKVLGTRFNLNAYADEKSIKTTLLEGSVELAYSSGEKAVLKPGQQSRIEREKLIVKYVDAESVLDWKRGEINLRDDDFQATMRKIARWYDVDIVFAEDAPIDLDLRGLVSREKNISSVLKVIELTGKVHFKVEGRRVTVMK